MMNQHFESNLINWIKNNSYKKVCNTIVDFFVLVVGGRSEKGGAVLHHEFLGLSLSDWTAIIAIASTFLGALVKALTHSLETALTPLRMMIKELNDNIAKQEQLGSKREQMIQDNKMDIVAHTKELEDHERRISKLEDEK